MWLIDWGPYPSIPTPPSLLSDAYPKDIYFNIDNFIDNDEQSYI